MVGYVTVANTSLPFLPQKCDPIRATPHCDVGILISAANNVPLHYAQSSRGKTNIQTKGRPIGRAGWGSHLNANQSSFKFFFLPRTPWPCLLPGCHKPKIRDYTKRAAKAKKKSVKKRSNVHMAGWRAWRSLGREAKARGWAVQSEQRGSARTGSQQPGKNRRSLAQLPGSFSACVCTRTHRVTFRLAEGTG